MHHNTALTLSRLQKAINLCNLVKYQYNTPTDLQGTLCRPLTAPYVVNNSSLLHPKS